MITFASLMALLAVSSTENRLEPGFSCQEAAQASATAYQLADLPQDIRDDLIGLTGNSLGDSNATLLHSDAPQPAALGLPSARFAQAMLFNGRWFVQLEVSMFSGVHTIGYVRHSDGFRRSPIHHFRGPACESIRAAFNGVTTLAPF